MDKPYQSASHILCIPGLTYHQVSPGNTSPSLPFTPLNSFLSKSIANTQASFINEPNLDCLFQVETDNEYLSLASYLFPQDKITHFQDKYSWVYCVSPIHLHPDMNAIIVKADVSSDFTQDEYSQLCESINSYFNESDEDLTWELSFDSEVQQLFLLSSKDLNCYSKSIKQVLGKDVSETELNHFSPYWRQTLTEIQMLLFQSPINVERKTQDKLSINSLWFDGGGELPIQKSRHFNPYQFDRLITDNKVIASLCKKNNLDCDLLNFNDDKTIIIKGLFDSKTMIYITSLELSLNTGNSDLYYKTLENLEQIIVEPVITTIKQNNEKILITGDKDYYQLSKPSILSRLLNHLKPWFERVR